MIDFHNHLLPGVDDGAADLDETRAAMAEFRAQGATGIIVTPHFQASVAGRPEEMAGAMGALDAAWEAVRAMAAAEFPDLRLQRGVEVLLDTPTPDLSDPRIRLGGSALVLVEFPFFSVPPHAENVLFELKLRGWTPVIAHPERYSNLAADLAAAGEWKRMGAFLQVNAGSVLGKYGPEAAERAWGLLRGGLADYVCSDYHARGTLHTTAFLAALERAGGELQGRLLTRENPERLWRGEPPVAVPPLPGKPSVWQKLFRRG
ncbi:tyrosine-protein phosphatase [Longimicrobium sp.]|uniref:tyrosine-protein phosphatase n=1 Tax=Longimicrobium sp. TaxID=2029185 RepID=UPI002C0D4CE3|nr:CpsB/CapC family capsule biosynthesis tyrosine phosphatase [Longimicrobium sp.]HSU17074.1 CpsB/CapC family capsule biosynthesis tyrosine phosphatase [Longimicrobium sp.]